MRTPLQWLRAVSMVQDFRTSHGDADESWHGESFVYLKGFRPDSGAESGDRPEERSVEVERSDVCGDALPQPQLPCLGLDNLLGALSRSKVA